MKAQIKTFESIAVLLVFFFLFGIGIRFYGAVQAQEYEAQKEQFAVTSSIETANIVMNLAELSCTQQGIRQLSCVDLLKAQVWAGQQESLALLSRLGTTKVTLTQVYPISSPPDIVIYDQTPREYESAIPTYVFVTVFNPLDDQYGFGYLTVVSYQ